MAEDYESMTVAQLKELLREHDLPVSGKKSDLIARLQDAAEQDDDFDEEAAPVEADEPKTMTHGTMKTGTTMTKTSTR